MPGTSARRCPRSHAAGRFRDRLRRSPARSAFWPRAAVSGRCKSANLPRRADFSDIPVCHEIREQLFQHVGKCRGIKTRNAARYVILVAVDEILRGRVIVLVEFHLAIIGNIRFLSFNNALVAKPVLGGQGVARNWFTFSTVTDSIMAPPPRVSTRQGNHASGTD